VRLIKWDMKSNEFKLGQWFKGRVYEDKCDLMPNGKKLVYYAAKHHRRSGLSSWIAISTPPYFTAHTLWQAMGTWNETSLFEDDETLLLPIYSPEFDKGPYEGFSIPRQLKVRPRYWQGFFYRLSDHLRLLRDRWTVVRGDPIYRAKKSRSQEPLVYRKSLSVREVSSYLELAIAGHSNVTFSYRICDGASDPITLEADWADVHGESIYLTREGRLLQIDFWMQGNKRVLSVEKQIADFTDMEYEEILAPDDARRW
jgi:hypothetical protein